MFCVFRKVHVHATHKAQVRKQVHKAESLMYEAFSYIYSFKCTCKENTGQFGKGRLYLEAGVRGLHRDGDLPR